MAGTAIIIVAVALATSAKVKPQVGAEHEPELRGRGGLVAWEGHGFSGAPARLLLARWGAEPCH